MTTPNADSRWSIKDTLAHLTFWHQHLLNLMYGVVHHREPVLVYDENKDIDENNEQFYQQSRDVSLEEVLRNFRDSHRLVVEQLQQLTAEQLLTLPWSDSEAGLWDFVAGNTFEHYEEHLEPIRAW